MEIDEFLTTVQGSDELKSKFISSFTKAEFGKEFLNKFKENNTPKYFDVDEKGKIINNDKLDPRIGELIGHERSRVHSTWDEKVEGLTGSKRPEGEGKGWAEKALQDHIDNKITEAKGEPDNRIQELKELHIKELQSIKDNSLKVISDYDAKYNELNNEYVGTKKDIAWSKALSEIGVNISELDDFKKSFLNEKLNKGKGNSFIENGKIVLKNDDGTIMRKPNQEDMTPEDFLKESLAPLLNGRDPKSGGGASLVTPDGGVNSAGILAKAETRTQATTLFNETMAKRGVSPSDKEYRVEHGKLINSDKYNSLKY